MKYYTRSVIRNMTYEQALNSMNKGLYVSREEWNGLHFKRDDEYYILLKTGEILKNPENVYNKESNDWCVVIPTKDAVSIIKNI